MVLLAQERKNNQPTTISNKLEFITNDIRYISLNRKFDSIVSLFHVMSYQCANIDIIKSLKNVSNHLQPGGIFIFDCWYGPAVLSDKPYKRTKNFENTNILVSRIANPKMYPTLNQVDVEFKIVITNKSTNQIKKVTEIHRMRYFFNPEIEYFLENSGLQLLHCEQWLTRDIPSFNSWYVTFICQKN